MGKDFPKFKCSQIPENLEIVFRKTFYIEANGPSYYTILCYTLSYYTDGTLLYLPGDNCLFIFEDIIHF